MNFSFLLAGVIIKLLIETEGYLSRHLELAFILEKEKSKPSSWLLDVIVTSEFLLWL